MGKKDNKTKAAEKKQRAAQKAQKIEKKKEKKGKSDKNDQNDSSDAEDKDFDIDAVLANYAREQEQFLKVTETTCNDPPSARSAATLIASPENANELFLFGGEYYDGSTARFFNDLFVCNIRRDEWRSIHSRNTPLPRSGHAWTRGSNDGTGIYLFGGEFSSPRQGQFYHYNDFWRLDAKSREWAKIETKGKRPPARSGHRMTCYKQYILLFGGFQDTSAQTRYLGDVWVYDTLRFEWYEPKLPPASQRPDPRSSLTFLPHESGAVLYGGYSRVKASGGGSSKTSSSGKGGGGTASKVILKPVVHQDTWFLRVTQSTSSITSNSASVNAVGGGGSPPLLRWERRKRPANAPNPPRAGCTLIYHKGRGIGFGGVHDIENSEEGIDSEFFNTLDVWNIERNRFFSLTLRKPRVSQKRQGADMQRGRRGGRGKADEEDLLKNLAALETKGPEETSNGVSQTSVADQRIAEDEDDDEEREDPTKNKNVIWEMPHPRFNAQLACQNDVLYIYGGTFEKGDREYTFDELWAIDLGKLDGVKEIFRRPLENWMVDEEESDDSDDDEGSENEEEDDDEDEYETSTKPAAEPGDSTKVSGPSTAASTSPTDASTEPSSQSDDSQPAESSLTDSLPHPRPFESLRDFFARTSDSWQESVMVDLKKKRPESAVGGLEMSVKELRKEAFEKAESKWWDCREEIRVLEDEQEAAGIGEVVDIKDKAGQGAVGKRR
ncbi:MAG: hypothetical protein M1831_004674 [Alyxoria varia]|nr:MAG: hypothetical protein M1831_004674 [Alyxoria varia]